MYPPCCARCKYIAILDNKCLYCGEPWVNTYRDLSQFPGYYESRKYYEEQVEGWQDLKVGRMGLDKWHISGMLNLLDGKRLLEVGCGRGEMAYALANKGADVFAIDISSAAVAVAKENAARWLAPGVKCPTFTQADVTELKPPLGETPWDIITFCETLEHIPFQALRATLDRLHDSMNPDGIIVWATTYYPMDETDSEHCTGLNRVSLNAIFHRYKPVLRTALHSGRGLCEILMRAQVIESRKLLAFERTEQMPGPMLWVDEKTRPVTPLHDPKIIVTST